MFSAWLLLEIDDISFLEKQSQIAKKNEYRKRVFAETRLQAAER